MLWSAAMEKGYAAPVWMTFKQARELKANVRTGEHGSLVVYADKIIGTEADTVRTRDSFHEGLHGLQCRADRQYAWHVQRNLAIADNYRDFAREIERTVAIVWVPIVPSD
jgi:N-terminal domain of anti-restriction factor ArdC